MTETDQGLERLKSLCSGISHDLNNFSSIVQGYIELLRMDMEFPPECEGYLQKMQQACDRILERSRTFESFSHSRQLPLSTTDIEPLLRQEAEGLERVALLLPATLPKVPVHPDSFRLVVRELLSNALEAAEEGEVRLAVTCEGDRLALTVTNPSPPLDTFTQQRLFDPYFSTRGKGRGFGLPKVHGLVQAQGGEIRVQRPREDVTQFQVVLPLTAPAEWSYTLS